MQQSLVQISNSRVAWCDLVPLQFQLLFGCFHLFLPVIFGHLHLHRDHLLNIFLFYFRHSFTGSKLPVKFLKNKDIYGLFTPSESERESEKDQRTIGSDQRENIRHQKNPFSHSLLSDVYGPLHSCILELEFTYQILFYNAICFSLYYDLCWCWYLWKITKFLLCRKIFCVMYCEVEIWLMLHSDVDFGQNMKVSYEYWDRDKIYTWSGLVSLKFYWVSGIAIFFLNSKFCAAWTSLICEFTSNFSKTSTPQISKLATFWMI